MDRMKDLLKQHRKGALIALFALIVFTAFSVTNAMKVSTERAQEAQAQNEAAKQGQSEITDDATDVKAQLTKSQKKLIDGYDDETKELIKKLGASVFSANGGRNTLRFHDTYYVETVNGKDETHPYAISTVEFGTNGSDSEIDRIVFETDTGTHIASYTLVLSADSDKAGSCTIASTTMFSLTDMPYERTDAVKKVQVTGLNSEITSLLGDTDKLTEELSDWCSVHFPVATTASWVGTCTINANENTVMTAFTIGDDGTDGSSNSATASVSVTYDRADKSYSFKM